MTIEIEYWVHCDCWGIVDKNDPQRILCAFQDSGGPDPCWQMLVFPAQEQAIDYLIEHSGELLRPGQVVPMQLRLPGKLTEAYRQHDLERLVDARH